MTRKLTFLILALFALIAGPGAKAWGQSVTMSYTGTSTTNMGAGNNATSVNLDASHWNVEADKGGNSNYPGLNKAGQIRLYGATNNHNVITVTNSDGATITNITVTYSGSNNNNAKVTVGASEVTGTGSDTEKTYSINSSSFSIAHNYNGSTQVYISSVVINYSASSTPSITVTNDNVTLDYNATEGQFDYSISNPATGVNMVASTEDNWISNITVNESNVAFTTTENEAQAQRVGTITLSYTGATSKYVTVTQAAAPEEGLLFYESFDTNDGTGGNDDKWSGSIASKNLESDNEDWTFVKGNGANKCAKFGTGSAKGSATTPSISYNGDATLTFKAAAWDSNSEGTTLNISATSGTLSQASVTLVKGAWTEYSIDITNVTNSTQITFEAVNASSNRFFLDEVKVVEAEAPYVATPTFTPAAGTYYEAQTVEISCATEDAIIYYTIDGTDPTAESTEYTDAITVSETTTVKAIAYVGNEASNVATAVYTIIPTYASLADLIAAGEPTTAGTPVNVTLTDETITGFYTSSGDYRNGIFLQVGDQEIEIYCHDVPEEWVIGGKVSGTLEDCTWKLYGDTWELCPDSWDDLTYLGPSFAIEIDDEMENGSIEIEDAQATATAGTEISFTVTPDEGYRMAAESLIVMDATGEEVEVSGNNPYTFTMPASDVTISAEFELLSTTTYQYLYSVNGVSGDELEAHEGESITLTTSEDLNDDFTFAGWTTDENDVENILAAGSSYIVNDEVIFYAVYAKEGQCIGEKTVILDGSTLSSTATTEETTHTIDGVSYKFSAGAKKQAIQTDAVNYFKDGDAVLIGKSGAHIYNDNPFGEGITKFEIYANKGASAKVSVGVYFSTIAITEYATGESTWTETLSTVDNVYDASGKLPDGAKYFWYQVTNANNSQIQFRITYKEQTATTKYYTRVFNETATADITIAGPSIIPAGSMLNMGTYTLNNGTASNLVIEDGAQLIQNSSNVMATVQKNITGYTGDNDNYYLIANPTDNDVVANLTSNEYDLYSFDPCGDKDGYEWINEEGEEVFVKPYSNEDGSAVAVGYLYANSEDVTLEFAGVLNPAGSTDIELTYAEEGEGREFPGFNLIGNPYTCNAYVNGYNFYTMADGEFVINEGSATIAPCEGFFVEATEANQSVTVSTAAPVTAPNALSLNVSQNRGNVIDRAIVRFDGANDLHKFMMNPAHTNLSIAKGGETFAAISTEAEGELPVNFKAEKNGTYTITVNTKNVDAEYLHLIDNMTGMDVDLLSTPSYTFEAKTSDYASRFKLVFGVNNTASESSDSNFAFMSDGNLVINNIEGEATLQIVDELGRVISTETVSGSYNKALNLKAGLYIINLNGMTQKIVVE